MKKYTRLTTVVLIAVLLGFWGAAPHTAQAQIGKLKNKLKNATEKQEEKAPEQTQEAPASGSSGTQLKKRDLMQEQNAPVALKPLVYDAPFKPKVTYESLLKGVTIRPESGQLRIRQTFTCSFMPEKEKGGTFALYGVKPEKHKLTVHLNKGGQTLGKYMAMVMQSDAGGFRSKRKGPFADFSVVTSSNGYVEKAGYDTEEYAFTEAGAYELVFLLDGEPFQRFPFNVNIAKSDDPYAAKPALYTLSGPWSDVGYVHIPENKDDGYVTFYTFLRRTEAGKMREDFEYRVEILRSGQSLGQVKKHFGAKDTWNEIAIPLSKGGGDNLSSSFLGKDLRPDGKYEIRISYFDPKASSQGKDVPVPGPNGQVKDAYAFEVKGGKIQPQGWQNRATAEELEVVEGGADQFWILRQGGAYFK